MAFARTLLEIFTFFVWDEPLSLITNVVRVGSFL
jgi:hypothetical protein